MSESQEVKIQILSDYRNLLTVPQLELLRTQLGILVDCAVNEKTETLRNQLRTLREKAQQVVNLRGVTDSTWAVEELEKALKETE